jgi:hypothetical protein
MRPDGALRVLGPFAGTKGPRLPGRNPASQKSAWTFSLDKRAEGFLVNLEILRIPKISDGFPKNIVMH